MKIATFNVNSIRKRLSIVIQWLHHHQPDVLCLQETKAQDSDFPVEALSGLGYHLTYRGMKAYNGVAVFSRTVPEMISFGFDQGPDTDEPRLIHVNIQGISVINTYVPQGFKIDSPKYQYKLQWFQRLRDYFAQHLSPEQPAIWCGDMNVAPAAIDVHHPEKHLTHVCFHHDAQQAYQKTVDWGFVDVFRLHYPDRQQFTFWDYRQPPAVLHNRGWRIDHILATPALAKTCRQIEVDLEPRMGPNPSDHTVLWAEFGI
ncbi:MAG: exodeoxyribonuclease III [Nitrospirales bacterium]|nr:exodeoxyribonuclease III [Nitrospirales bacterium]